MGIMGHTLVATNEELLARQSWYDFLAGYFDGQPHSFGSEEVTFPSGNVGFHAPDTVGKPGTLDANKVEVLISNVSTESRVSYRKKTTAWDERQRWEILLLGYSPVKSRRLLDQATSCMRRLLHSGRHVLATSGLRIREVQGPAELGDPASEYQLRRFYVITRSTVTTAPAASGQSSLAITGTVV